MEAVLTGKKINGEELDVSPIKPFLLNSRQQISINYKWLLFKEIWLFPVKILAIAPSKLEPACLALIAATLPLK